MLSRIAIAVLLSLLLAGCGRGSEDFTVEVARPVDKVTAAFDGIGLAPEVASLFPGLKVVRTEPGSRTVLYTLPGDGDFPASIKLTFTADGPGTTVHAAIDVPNSTTVKVNGKETVINEATVEQALRSLMRSAAEKLDEGADIEIPRRDFSRTLTVLAIVTDSKQLRLAQDINRFPDWYESGLGWLSDLGGGNDFDYGDDHPRDDPDHAAYEDEFQRQQEERRDQSQAEENAQPMDETHGDSVGGDYDDG